MSVAFTAEGRTNPNTQSVQALLDENSQLIQAIVDYQNKGKAYESTRYQQLLHRNLIYLATLADSSQPTQGSQGLSQGGGMPKPVNSVSPPIHSQGPQPVPGSMMGGDASNMSQANSDPMSTSSQSYPGMGAPSGSSNFGPGNMPGTPSPPQLQHPPVSGQNVGMSYQSPSNQQVRSQGPSVMGGGIQNINQQSQMPRPMPQQHMMPQSQQTQQQQYLMQQRQMPYRQPPSQQQPISAPNPTTYNQQQSSGMLPGYQQQQQPQQQVQQRYNPYRPPPQQQTLSHMPYPQQQNQMVMGQSQMGRTGQIPMGQSTMGQSAMGPGMSQSPMGQPPV